MMVSQHGYGLVRHINNKQKVLYKKWKTLWLVSVNWIIQFFWLQYVKEYWI